MYETLAILTAFAFMYSVLATRLERTPINGAVIFLAFGFVAGPKVLNLFDLDVTAEGLRTVAELTLALVLFSDAANADLGTLRKSFRIPQRMLLIALPLTIALGVVAGRLLFPDLPILSVAILATVLAPTDAALGKAVVTNEKVPAPVREGLNVESGLNDGICVPILFTFLAFAGGTEGSVAEIAFHLVAEEIGIGLVVGVGLSVAGHRAVLAAHERGWLAEPWTQLPVVALALTCFAGAQALGGSGFIASFTGGLVFGGLVKGKQAKEILFERAEGHGNVLSMLTWILFGTAFLGDYLEYFDGRVLLFALLSLTIVRMLPTSLSLLGLGIRLDAQLFLGWFGPRGLASIVFAVIVAGEKVEGIETIATVVVTTVTLSILAHGLSANPFADAFAARVATDPKPGA